MPATVRRIPDDTPRHTGRREARLRGLMLARPDLSWYSREPSLPGGDLKPLADRGEDPLHLLWVGPDLPARGER
jgi:hypothetical protein